MTLETPVEASERYFAEQVDPVDFITSSLVDWRTARSSCTGQDFLIEPLITTGRAHLLWAEMKAGKSLFLFWLLARAALGLRALDRPAGSALKVLYLDAENSLDDLVDRLDDFGIDLDELQDAGVFHYSLLPQILHGIDNYRDAEVIVKRAEALGVDVVVIDTAAAFVTGVEDGADTWSEVARLLTGPLKRRQIASVRLDHPGRDPKKGARGSSAKNADADVVWKMEKADRGGFKFTRTHSRMPWVPEHFDVHQTDDPLGWRRVKYEYPAGTKEAAARLDELGVPVDATATEATAILRAADGEAKRKLVLLAALRYRREAQ